MSDYPHEADLKRIKTWPHEDPSGWFAFVKATGHWWPDEEPWGWSERDDIDDLFDKPVRRFDISTGGWSGNEEILDAMRENFVLWSMSWYSHTRGGHYVFMAPKKGSGDA